MASQMNGKLWARSGLRALGGWRYEGELPKPRRAVCLLAPHTDNMDGLLLVLLAGSVNLELSWMIKDDWFRPPMGSIIRRLGGVPVDRSGPRGLVDRMVQQFSERDHFLLAIPPEGTRKRAEYWRSGFYRIALEAKVPVVPGFLDYRRRVGGFGDGIELTGEVKRDMDKIRAYYAKMKPQARHPEQFGPVRLRDE